MEEERDLPALRVHPATETFPSTLPRELRNPLGPDDTCSTMPSNYSSESSYQPSLSIASVALDKGLMGTTRVAEGDEGFVNAYNMLTGIRTAVSTVCAKPKPEIRYHHYAETQEFTFGITPYAGTHGTHGSKAPFKFKDYAPHVFREVRESVFKLDPADYLMSLTGKYIVSELTSPGKSGSFFYYSRDYRFIIKTIHHSEHRRLRLLLENYYKHVKKYPDTLISRYFGLHRVTLPFGKRVHFVVMNNVFPALYEIHHRFDLKGSTIGRTCGVPLDQENVCFKDLDWLARKEQIMLGPHKKAELLKQLQLDVDMLQKCGVMDYSLLIGIHDLKKGNENIDAILKLHDLQPEEIYSTFSHADDYGHVNTKKHEELRSFNEFMSATDRETFIEFDLADESRSSFKFYHDRGGYQSTYKDNLPSQFIYYMGVIDFLTYYNTRKRLETKGKGVLHHKDKKGLSAIPANEYGARFLNFIASQIKS